MISKIKKNVGRHLANIPGWRTDRKIIVIESDDWGSIRMPSKESINKLKDSGLPVDGCHYMMNDSLASEEDLDTLFNHLSDIRNINGIHPVITANTIVANPDFERIKNDNYEKYHYELFTDTFLRYADCSNSLEIWKDGIESKLFYPQFHGREHLHVLRWLNDLRRSDPEIKLAFENRLYGISSTVSRVKRKSYQAAYDYETNEELIFVLDAIKDGLQCFEDIFGYKSLSTIAPNYIWDREIEKILKNSGVKYLQGGRVQRFPGKYKKKYARRYLGEVNELNQLYLIRNCTFEPSSDRKIDWVQRCFQEVETAFFWKKPAIIDSHRVNFIGSINPDNRKRSLKALHELLTQIVNKWPDIEFMTSDQLGTMIEDDEK